MNNNDQLPFVEIWTDGSAIPNPGAGGWGVLIRQDGQEQELSGEVVGITTNNSMELTAAIQGLKALSQRSRVMDL